MKQFVINKHLCLRLEKNQTVIYVDGEPFDQCKYILLSRKIDELEELLSLDSIDELAGKLDNSMERKRDSVEISTETEFWAHCSNLQMWYENNYDSRLLHSNLAFPLLKRLTEVNDIKAQGVFREEIAKRFESRYPSVVAYLIRERYYEFLPFDYLINIIIDRDLFKTVTDEGYEFDFGLYLNGIGEKYSRIIKNKIIDIIHDQRLDDLMFLHDNGLLENLNKKDLIHLIESSEIDLVGKFFEALMDSEKYDYYYQDGFFFYDKVMDNARRQISKKLVEIIKRDNREQNLALIRLDLLMYVNMGDLIPVIQDSELDIIEMSLDLNKNEPIEGFPNFTDKIGEIASQSIRNYFCRILKENNLVDLTYALEVRLLDNLNQDDLVYLIEEHELLFIEKIIEITKEIDPKSSFLSYGSPFNDKVLSYTCKSLKSKIIEIIEKDDEYDIKPLIRLKLTHCLSKDELKSLLNRPEINFLEYILKVKSYEFEDVEEWFPTFFEMTGKYLSGSVRSIIVNYIRSDRLEDLSYFFDLEVLRYLNEKDKKELYKFLKINEERIQKRDYYYEKEYFNEILGLI